MQLIFVFGPANNEVWDGIKDDFQSALRSLGTPVFASLDEMRIDVIR